MVLDPLELEFQEVVSHQVGAGKESHLEHVCANVSQRLEKESQP